MEETLTFRYTLITIYDLINTDHSLPVAETKVYEKRGSFNYFSKINTLIDEFDFAQKNGNNKSFELFQYLVEYIMILENTHELNDQEANALLARIRDSITKKNQSQESLTSV